MGTAKTVFDEAGPDGDVVRPTHDEGPVPPARRLRDARAPSCGKCGSPTVAFEVLSTYRIAQFAFVVPTRGRRCTGCGREVMRDSDACGYVEAMAPATDRVGLPGYGSPLYSEENEAEWQRREGAPPEVTVKVRAGEDGAAIVARLDADLAARGRPPRGVGLRLVR